LNETAANSMGIAFDRIVFGPRECAGWWAESVDIGRRAGQKSGENDQLL
jgi:hypothetical protein